MSRRLPLIAAFCADLLLLVAAFLLAHQVSSVCRTGTGEPFVFPLFFVAGLCGTKLFFLFRQHLYCGFWRYIGMAEARHIAVALFYAFLLLCGALFLYNAFAGVSRLFLLLDTGFSFLFLWGFRWLLGGMLKADISFRRQGGNIKNFANTGGER